MPNARTTSKPKPGSAESIRRQTAELESATALLKAAKVVEPELVEQDDFARMQAFSRAYARWLRARAALKGDDELPEGPALFAEERAALRELFCSPALHLEDIWQKFEALEAELGDELVIGPTRDSVLPLALGSIKNDLHNLDLGRAA